ncbi:hypothetical protein [Bradyrhizobium sp. OAE829]|uniref:hypothetical protein n=1 Tax=Bradyrhizobium sp. OAE829 TaxID=2663807 RepID=UPI00178BE339
MKRGPAAFAIAASLFAPVANANDALEAKVRAYVPVVSLAKFCDIRISDAILREHPAMLAAVKSDPNAQKLAFRLNYETQTAYTRPATQVNGSPSARTSSQPTANTARHALPPWSRAT